MGFFGEAFLVTAAFFLTVTFLIAFFGATFARPAFFVVALRATTARFAFGRVFEAVARFFAVFVEARRVAVCDPDRLKPFVTALIS